MATAWYNMVRKDKIILYKQDLSGAGYNFILPVENAYCYDFIMS